MLQTLEGPGCTRTRGGYLRGARLGAWIPGRRAGRLSGLRGGGCGRRSRRGSWSDDTSQMFRDIRGWTGRRVGAWGVAAGRSTRAAGALVAPSSTAGTPVRLSVWTPRGSVQALPAVSFPGGVPVLRWTGPDSRMRGWKEGEGRRIRRTSPRWSGRAVAVGILHSSGNGGDPPVGRGMIAHFSVTYHP